MMFIRLVLVDYLMIFVMRYGLICYLLLLLIVAGLLW